VPTKVLRTGSICLLDAEGVGHLVGCDQPGQKAQLAVLELAQQ